MKSIHQSSSLGLRPLSQTRGDCRDGAARRTTSPRFARAVVQALIGRRYAAAVWSRAAPSKSRTCASIFATRVASSAPGTLRHETLSLEIPKRRVDGPLRYVLDARDQIENEARLGAPPAAVRLSRAVVVQSWFLARLGGALSGSRICPRLYVFLHLVHIPA